jgi:G3E family GTPase
MDMLASKIPVTVITGFLGAGKTTLVNRLLTGVARERIGVVVNEFGEIGVDGALIDADEDAVIELRNGCVCCTVRADLVGSVMRLLDVSDRAIDRLVVETSGLADPAPVLQTFLADEDLLQRVVLDSVVTVVDAVHLHLHMDDDIVREQIAFADTVIVNKISMLERASVAPLLSRLRLLNPTAMVLQADQAQVAIEDVLGTSRFSLSSVLAIEPDLLCANGHDHEHDASIQSCSFVTEQPLNADRFNQWIRALVARDGANLLRCKGILAFQGEARKFHFHSVHMLLDARPGKRHGPGEPRESRIVFIGRNLNPDELKEGFLACADLSALAPA